LLLKIALMANQTSRTAPFFPISLENEGYIPSTFQRSASTSIYFGLTFPSYSTVAEHPKCHFPTGTPFPKGLLRGFKYRYKKGGAKFPAPPLIG
ncbi:MAG: hypothetical protein K8R79_11495, partial [Calditrichales bacterium]|nr:hypothetical protein [Calditrichales bacterium]